jgi:hypothetical protein
MPLRIRRISVEQLVNDVLGAVRLARLVERSAARRTS